jgi:chemotaxis protein methyltransferase CheR
LHAALVPGGWLVLGPSDPRPGLLADFEMHAGDGAVIYRRFDHDKSEPTAPPHPRFARPLPEGEVIQVPPPDPTPAPLQVADAPDWREPWLAARASADGGQLDEAEAHCQQAIARARLRPEPYYLYGSLRQARGDDEASLAAFRKALYVDPTFVPALLAQAALHRRGGASDRARQALVRAQRLLEGRLVDELVLAEDGLTVGRLRDAVLQALANDGLQG